MSGERMSRRVQGFTESVIREMTRVVDQLGGVNLAQGMPNFPPPRELIDAAHQALEGDFHQYSVTWGAPPLRRAIADKYRKFYGLDIDPERRSEEHTSELQSLTNLVCRLLLEK